MKRGLRLSPVDITIIWGWRDEAQQNMMVRSGASKTPWPQSKHNFMIEGVPTSLAVDYAPWINGGIPWDDTHAFAIVYGCLYVAAEELGIRVRYGGDWNMNGLTTDQTFMDWGHIEEIR